MTLVSVGAVYQISLNTEKSRLNDMVKSQMHLIDAVVHYEKQLSGKALTDTEITQTLFQIVETLDQQNGFGKTGEFVLGKRLGENIVFLTMPRHLDHSIDPTPIQSDAAEPMRRALLGQSGMLTGFDYRSEAVIAAHELIPQLSVGLVAKIDLAEFRAPFIKASIVACFVAVFLIVLGMLLLRQIEVQVSKIRVPGQRAQGAAIISPRERFLYFVLIMITISTVITGTAVSLLYAPSYESAKSYLLEMVKAQTNLMETMSDYDAKAHFDAGAGAVSHVVEAFKNQDGFGSTGEFVLGQRIKDDIVFLSPPRHLDQAIKPIHITSLEAKPMQQALMGRSGVLVGLDYRAVEVLAAYQAVEQLNLGLVAKIDRSELRSPFIQASLLSFGAALIVIVFGALILVRGKDKGFVDKKADAVESVVRNGFSYQETKVSPFLILFVSGLSLAIFALDLATPLGIAGGIPYVLVVLAGWWFPSRRHIVVLAVISSIFTMGGYALAPEGAVIWIVLANRVYSLVVIWVTTIILSLGKASELVRKRQSEELAKLSLAVEHSPSSVTMTTVDGDIEYVNQKFSEVTGYGREEVIGQNMSILRSGQTSPETYKQLWETLLKGDEWRDEILNKKKDGSFYWDAISILPIKSPNGDVLHYVALQEDITDRKHAEEQLQHMANHDSLTGLPTRRLGLERITSALATARRDKNMVAILFIDLDGFKAVNDTLGHESGDQVLIGVSERLLTCIREVDTVARIGGDEFMAVLGGIETQDDAAAVADKLVKAISQPFVLGEETAMIGASIGVSLYPEHEQEPEMLLKSADAAMYGVKNDGKNNFSFASK